MLPVCWIWIIYFSRWFAPGSTFLRTVVWVLLRPTRTRPGFSSLPKKTRKSNRLQILLQRQNFLLSYLMALSVSAAGVGTRDLPLSRPALSQLSYLGCGQFLRNFCFNAILCLQHASPLLTLLSTFCRRRRSKGQRARSEIISDPIDIQKVG